MATNNNTKPSSSVDERRNSRTEAQQARDAEYQRRVNQIREDAQRNRGRGTSAGERIAASMGKPVGTYKPKPKPQQPQPANNIPVSEIPQGQFNIGTEDIQKNLKNALDYDYKKNTRRYYSR